MLDNTNRAIKKENPEILATFGTEDTRQRQKKTKTYVLEISMYKQTQHHK